jgi:hypothetical protein
MDLASQASTSRPPQHYHQHQITLPLKVNITVHQTLHKSTLLMSWAPVEDSPKHQPKRGPNQQAKDQDGHLAKLGTRSSS